MSTSQDPREFRNALGKFATGVTVITALDAAGQPVGMTANSFSSVSLDPMLVLWSIAKTSGNFDVFNEAEHYAIHVLHSGQQAISGQFASKEGDRFNGLEVSEGVGGTPILPEYSAVFQCQSEHRYEGGDHIILVGRVVEFDQRDSDPLIFHSGRYLDMPANA